LRLLRLAVAVTTLAFLAVLGATWWPAPTMIDVLLARYRPWWPGEVADARDTCYNYWQPYSDTVHCVARAGQTWYYLSDRGVITTLAVEMRELRAGDFLARYGPPDRRSGRIFLWLRWKNPDLSVTAWQRGRDANMARVMSVYLRARPDEAAAERG